MPDAGETVEYVSRSSDSTGARTTNDTKTTNIPIFEKAPTSNILHKYRTFNYLFTLACIKRDSLLDPQSLRDSEDYYLVAKSAGKGNSIMKENVDYTAEEITKLNNARNATSNNPEDTSIVVDALASHRDIRQKLVEGFNKNSSGRFDFFIDNLEIESLMGGNNKTNLSIATNITFDVFEPYSINGFLEALQVSAVAAGHVNYVSAPYLLKVEFVGHSDELHTSSSGEKIGKEASRYFIIIFNTVNIEMTGEGTTYKCAATPFSERAYGEISNKLKTPVQITGKTVKEILTNLQQALNDYEKTSALTVYRSDVNYDKYEILFPSLTSQGLDFTKDNQIAESRVNEFLKSNQNYRFPEVNSAARDYAPVALFADNSNIHDAIIAILRDSQYTKDIVIESQKTNPKVIDSSGFVTYFSVNVELNPQKVWNSALNRPFYTYRYLIVPYKLHYTRIPLLQNKTVDTSQLRSIIAREYDYLYTGNNTDILNFNLTFNHLYYQAIPTYLGNTPLYSTQYGIQPSPSAELSVSKQQEQDELQRNIATAPVAIDLRNNNIQVASGLTTPQDLSDPYDAMVKNFHQAILDNLDQVEARIQILGDPYYLLDGGISNYYPKLISSALTVDGQAPQYVSDVFINISFRNPFDIDPGTGQYLFSNQNKLVPFSGVFRLIEVTSRFISGSFEQELKLLRVPGQVIDTNKRPEKTAAVETKPKIETVVPAARTPTPTVRPTPPVSPPALTFPVRPPSDIRPRQLDIPVQTTNVSSLPAITELPPGGIDTSISTIQRDAAAIRAAGGPLTQKQVGLLATDRILNSGGTDLISSVTKSARFQFGSTPATNPFQQFINNRK
jgi:hypothetical protein